MGNTPRRYLLDYLDWTKPNQRLLARGIVSLFFSGGFFLFVILYFQGTNWVSAVVLSAIAGVGSQAAGFFLAERQGLLARAPTEGSSASEFSNENYGDVTVDVLCGGGVGDERFGEFTGLGGVFAAWVRWRRRSRFSPAVTNRRYMVEIEHR